MTIYYTDDRVTVHDGDCLDVLRELPDVSVDAVVCDPPYGLEFMGKGWDAPWLETGINADAGFSAVGTTDGYQQLPRPSFTGSTNPRCLTCGGNARGRRDGTALRKVCTCEAPRFPNVRAVEMRAFQEWCERWAAECLRVLKPGGHLLAFGGTRTVHRLTVGIEDAGFEIRDGIDWIYGNGFPKSLDVSKAIDKELGAERAVVGVHRRHGGGSQVSGSMAGALGTASHLPRTAPATEDAIRMQGWGTALKPAREPIVVARKPLVGTVAANVQAHGTGALNVDACRIPAGQDYADKCASVVGLGSNRNGDAYGEWTGIRADYSHEGGRWPTNVLLDESAAEHLDRQTHGQPSRYFPVFQYRAKADTKERPRVGGVAHPTVKPLDLMRWLVRLVTPPGGTVLDPFAGSGTTAEACVIEGFNCITVEREAAYLPLITARLTKPIATVLFGDLDGAA